MSDADIHAAEYERHWAERYPPEEPPEPDYEPEEEDDEV